MTEKPDDLSTFLWVALVVVSGVCVTLAGLYKQALNKIQGLHEKATQEAKAALTKEEAASALSEKLAQERLIAAETANKDLRATLKDNTDVLDRILNRLARKGGSQ